MKLAATLSVAALLGIAACGPADDSDVQPVVTAPAPPAADADRDMDMDTDMDAGDRADMDRMDDQPTIAELAGDVGDLSTLAAAVGAADLGATLGSDGPFTVFAPTNDAFGEIQSTVDTLLLPENKSQLQTVLTAHVVEGSMMSGAIVEALDGQDSVELTTVSGDTLIVTLEDGDVMIEDENGGKAKVVNADVEASNGVVHVVDAVLVPAM